MNDPTGTTTCFGFLGFFASLFPRTWPLAMGILLATTSEIRLSLQQQTQHKIIIDPYARMRGFIFRPDRERTTPLTVVRIAVFLRIAGAGSARAAVTSTRVGDIALPPRYFVWRLSCARAAGVCGKSATRASCVR